MNEEDIMNLIFIQIAPLKRRINDLSNQISDLEMELEAANEKIKDLQG